MTKGNWEATVTNQGIYKMDQGKWEGRRTNCGWRRSATLPVDWWAVCQRAEVCSYLGSLRRKEEILTATSGPTAPPLHHVLFFPHAAEMPSLCLQP